MFCRDNTWRISYTVNVLLFVGTNFRCFYEVHWSMGSWIRGFKYYWQQSMGKLYFVRFLFSWFKWTTKSAKTRNPWLIMISQKLSSWLLKIIILVAKQNFLGPSFKISIDSCAAVWNIAGPLTNLNDLELLRHNEVFISVMLCNASQTIFICLCLYSSILTSCIGVCYSYLFQFFCLTFEYF